ncbi:MAG: SDR family oxidoreductase [Rhodobacteraceae bacterium]|nr:SDR family oxidoreductase [Paracoccaceae bacterium]
MTTLLVTGANRGIGFQIASSGIELGWTVYGSVRTQQQAAELEATLPGIHIMVLDVCDRKAIEKAASSFAEPLDVLINNAGIIGPDKQSPLEMDFDGFERTLAVNTLAPLAVAQAFLPALKQSAHGRILTISSQMAWMGYAKSDRIAYRASKAAVNKVMQGLATDLEAEGIAVGVIDPGWVRTDMGGASAENDAEDVAKGILALADRFAMKDSGKFFKWSGEERPY